jgi:hypothetical protein
MLDEHRTRTSSETFKKEMTPVADGKNGHCRENELEKLPVLN